MSPRSLRERCRRDRDHLLETFVGRFGHEGQGPLVPAEVLDDVITEVLGYELVEEELPKGQLAVCAFERRRVTVSTCAGGSVRPNTDLLALANSTKAHELGHIRLHEEEILRTDRSTPDLFGEAPLRVLVTYRDELRAARLSPAELQREREADIYASVFLLPEGLLEEQPAMIRLRKAVERGEELSSRYLWKLTYDLGRFFQVSGTFMKSRLVGVGVVVYVPGAGGAKGELRVSRQAVLFGADQAAFTDTEGRGVSALQ